MNIQQLQKLDSKVVKVADALLCSDGVNWEWVYENKKPYSIKGSWVYFIVKNGVIMKVGGTGMKLVERARFYQSANHWKDKPGYCNAATNPIVYHYLTNDNKVELYAISSPIEPISIQVEVCGKIETITTNVDFRPIETSYRNKVEVFNIENLIIDEDLIWDGRALQHHLKSLDLKEVNLKINKRIPKGFKVQGENLVKV